MNLMQAVYAFKIVNNEKYYQDNKRNEELMDNKFPGKDITQEDLKNKIPTRFLE